MSSRAELVRRLGLITTVALTVWAPVGRLSPAPSAAPFSVWVVSSLERVGRNDAAGSVRSASLSAARGEYESFQVALRPTSRGAQPLSLEIADFQSRDGSRISRANVTIYSERYIHVPRSSPNWKGANRPLGPGWYPDGLVPLSARPPRVDAGGNNVFWVDVFVPRSAASGKYTSALKIKYGGVTASISVQLEVWAFELPVKPSLYSAFGYTGPQRRDIAETLLEHKLMPQSISDCRGDERPCPLNVRTERELMSRFGLAAINAGFWSGASYGECRMQPPPSLSAVRAATRAHADGLLLYNFTADEVHECPELVPQLKAWGRRLHAAGIKNLLTIPPHPDLFDGGDGVPAVDIWAMTPVMFEKHADLIAKARASGAMIWSYNASVQDAYSPKWQMDFLPINYRIQPGFLSQSLNLSGILYWRINGWAGNPWTEALDNTGRFAREASYPGEGFLVYPAEHFGGEGVFPSMRLKQLRDGVEDFEYVQILRSMGRADWALDAVRKVASDWSHWSQDAGALLGVRETLGREIDRSSRPAPANAAR